MNKIKGIINNLKVSHKLIIAITVTVFISLVLSGNFLNGYVKKQMTNNYIDSVNTLFISLQEGVSDSLERGQMRNFKRLLKRQKKIEGVMDVSLYDREGKLDMSSSDEGKGEKQLSDELIRKLSSDQSTYQVVSENDIKIYSPQAIKADCIRCHPAWKVGEQGGILTLTYDITELNTTIRQLRLILLITIIILLAVISVVILGITRHIIKPINESIAFFKEIAEGQGDLTKRFEVESNDELGEMAIWFNKFADKIQDMVRHISNHALKIADYSVDVKDTTKKLNSAITEKVKLIEGTAITTHEISQTIMDVARNATDASDAANEAVEKAADGKQIVEETASGMKSVTNTVESTAVEIEQLGHSSEQIGEIINTINDIADQTNLLALNAAIEAARAGEQGRGFAVVADEVRKLAERTSSSTSEISAMIGKIQGDTQTSVEGMRNGRAKSEEGLGYVEKAKESLDQIVSASENCLTVITSIATATEEQSTTIESLSSGMEDILELSRGSKEGIDDIDGKAMELSNIAMELKDIVSRFKI